MKVTKVSAPPALSRVRASERATITVAALQFRWLEDADAHKAQIADGVKKAKESGAQIVFLPELTLSRYPADVCPTAVPDQTAEPLETGETFSFLSGLAQDHGIFVHGSLFEKTGFEDGRGLNTAILVSPSGELAGRTPKLHIPVTEGYFEDRYFEAGPAQEAYPVHRLPLDSTELALGLPTCWDEWFPEVARCYALGGADVLCYPTAIGSEPDYPDFDTQNALRQVVTGHAIANGLFIAVPNRFGNEGRLNFYGGSFIVDPFGRVLAEAPRDREAVLICDIDLGQRQDWLTLFPFFATRRPDTYSAVTDALVNPRLPSGKAQLGGIPGINP